MFFVQSTLLALSALSALTSADKAGYHLPTSGTASTTQFYIGPELNGGTSCGASAFPNGKSPSGKQGGGPGYLYAAINQLAFGANPSVNGAGGPGHACGLCYHITPVSTHDTVLSAQSLTFMIVDECPASPVASGGRHCTQCHTSDVNDYGQHWHFDIAVDAMSPGQYERCFKGVTDGR
ncbi:MAG: hypothetical protein M1830_004749 [Pleopsidium flavum]|nr:MAG: hypothetical protein M1830_004749 [Pleopsidium flavum]